MKVNFGILGLLLILFSNNINFVFSQYSTVTCDNDYNSSSCANTTLSGSIIYKCRGFLSCKDSSVETSYDLLCQGDRSCKNVVYDNNDDDELWAFGYRSADSLTMIDESHDAYCYGYQSCLDIVFDQSDNGNDAEAHGYQAMYNSYIDYCNDVDSNGYEGLYYATINTSSVYNNEIGVVINGYYGSYETDMACQDGITCNFYAYGWYATEETYLFCLAGATCNIYCGETNGCIGMNLYCYSTATCYFDCDDATECPNVEDAQSTVSAMQLTSVDEKTAALRKIDAKYDKIMNERLNKKSQMQYEFKQERMREERRELAHIKASNEIKDSNNLESRMHMIESSIVLIIGMFIGIAGTSYYNKCVSNKDYQYESIV